MCSRCLLNDNNHNNCMFSVTRPVFCGRIFHAPEQHSVFLERRERQSDAESGWWRQAHELSGGRRWWVLVARRPVLQFTSWLSAGGLRHASATTALTEATQHESRLIRVASLRDAVMAGRRVLILYSMIWYSANTDKQSCFFVTFWFGQWGPQYTIYSSQVK